MYQYQEPPLAQIEQSHVYKNTDETDDNSTFGRELPLLLSVCWKNLSGASSAALQPPHDPSNVSETPVKVSVFLFLQQVELSECPSLGAATNARESQCQSDAFQVLSSPAHGVDASDPSTVRPNCRAKRVMLPCSKRSPTSMRICLCTSDQLFIAEKLCSRRTDN